MQWPKKPTVRSQEAVSRGVEYAKTGSYDAALEAYSQALELCPQNPDALVAAGAAHANQKDFQQAVHYFDKALGEGLGCGLVLSGTVAGVRNQFL